MFFEVFYDKLAKRSDENSCVITTDKQQFMLLDITGYNCLVLVSAGYNISKLESQSV